MNAVERKLVLAILCLLLFGGASRLVLSATEEPVSWEALPAPSGEDAEAVAERAPGSGASFAEKTDETGENGADEAKKTKKKSGRSGGKSAKSAKLPPLAEGERIDVNSASAQQLQRLPGVGPALAQAIVAYREEHGPFDGPENLLRVKGIGKGKLHSLSPKITFRK